MSASLVGSEMCIRDRFGAWERRPPEAPEAGCRSCGTVARGYVPLLLAPVSYTHLTLPTICSV
eukprot:12964665-Alexandrium_andersonii.AAC.1